MQKINYEEMRPRVDELKEQTADWFRRDRRRINLGREDRLIRACVALSLVLMSTFGLLGGFRISLIALGFGLAGLYFAVTAFTGRDEFYRRFDVDTRGEEELDEAAKQDEVEDAVAELQLARHAIIDESLAAAADDEVPWGNSLLDR